MADGEIATGRSPEKQDKKGKEMEEEDPGEDLYEVERVIGKSKIKGKTMYKVRWKGYGSEEDTWEPIENLESCLDIVEEYTQRLAEMARKRAEERKKKQKEKHWEWESEDSSEDPDAPYPSTFKNSFWKDLEAGRINVFDNDMYSKVKGRAARPSDLKEAGSSMSSSENEKSGPSKKRHSSDPTKDSVKASVKKTQKSKSTVKVKGKYSKGKSGSKSEKVTASARKIEFQITSESESDLDVINTRKSFPATDLVDNDSENGKEDIVKLADSLDQNAVLKTPERSISLNSDSQSTDSTKTVDFSKVESGSGEVSDKTWDKLLLSTPDGSKITDTSHTSSSTKTINYSLLEASDKEEMLEMNGEEKSEDPLAYQLTDRRVNELHHEKTNNVVFEQVQHKPETPECTFTEDDDIHTKSPSRKKKKKKHSKHKHHKHGKEKDKEKYKTHPSEDHGSSPLFKAVNQSTSEFKQKERKRKLSQSSGASSFAGDSVKSFKMPKLELEVSETDVTKIKIRNIHADLRGQSKSSGIENNKNSFNVSETLISRSHSFEKLDSIKTSSQSPVVSLCNQETSLSGNKTSQSVHSSGRSTLSSERSSENKTVKSQQLQPSVTDNNHNSVNVVNEPSTASRVPNPNVCNSANVRLERSNSEVEQADSGIASPASENGTDTSRKCYGNPLDDVLRRTELPSLGGERVPGLGGDQELGIELDDADWDLFDQEVKLEPINLTNAEFVAAVETGDYELVKRAFKGDGTYNLESPNMLGKTLLMKAAERAYDNIADLLIENGAKLDAEMHNGVTALMLACECAEICTVNLLLDHGSKVNLQNAIGETALMKAAKRGHKQMIWLLLECGANFNMQSHAGHTAMSYIKHLHHTECESIMTNHIYRVMHEFDKQVAITLNKTANIMESLFPAQLFNLCEDERFEVKFDCSVAEPAAGVGNLLFIGHTVFANHEVKCRFYGPCAVKAVVLNGQKQSSLTEEANFVLAFSPLVNGRNVLTIDTVKAPGVKAKLIVCAYKAQLIS